MMQAPRMVMLAALLLSGAVGRASPCGFDGPLGNNFSAMHPKSIGVALAVRDAVVAGVIEPAADPAVAGRAGYWRAVGHLTALQRALSSALAERHMPVSVLFIDSGLWSRLTPAMNGFAMDVHTDGAKESDAVVVTSEPVLTAILDKRLPVADALERGLLTVEGDPADAMRRLLAKALDIPASRCVRRRDRSRPDVRTAATIVGSRKSIGIHAFLDCAAADTRRPCACGIHSGICTSFAARW